MTHDALEQVTLRNNFYRDSYRKLAAALLALIAIILALVGIIFYQTAHVPTPKYFATTESGRIIQLTPLNQPNMSNAVTSIYDFNFTNFRNQLQNSRQYFTSSGWDAFVNAIKASNLLSTVQDKKLIVSAVLTAAPIVTTQYELGGRYVWKIQMPISVAYQGLAQTFSENYQILVTVQRVSTLDNISGVGINEFVAQRV
jgi:intracellular multiplication protein IcmL